MRLAMYQCPVGDMLLGLTDEGRINPRAVDPTLPNSIDELVRGGEGLLDRMRRACERAPAVADGQATFLPPLRHPHKILCVGKNYTGHAKELGGEAPSEPVFFSKLSTTLIGHGAPIVLPKESTKVDYEAELVVVIGKAGRRIPESQALNYVAGYACGHDVSARDWQTGKPSGQWLLGKSFDTFAPLGPAFVTADEVFDVQSLEIEMRLNGRVMQHSNTRHMIFSVPFLIAYVSAVCTLEPGDLIFTGTPEGVGLARKPPVFLQSGDVARIEIEGIGVLENPVVTE